MKIPIIAPPSLAEAVQFAMSSDALEEAQKQLKLNYQIGNGKLVRRWELAVSEIAASRSAN
jgi:hypothetical protein